jgi:formylglycine-generating enzyme required for sulfatase activity
VFLPSESEWYKAAYYDGPNTGGYFIYATSNNAIPNASGPTATPNSANYNNAVGNLTDVGVYTGTTSPYGAFDMNGNVYQWNEALISGSLRGMRGGLFANTAFFLQSSSRNIVSAPSQGNGGLGFRVASVPEPSTAVLAVVACGLMWVLRKRFS